MPPSTTGLGNEDVGVFGRGKRVGDMALTSKGFGSPFGAQMTAANSDQKPSPAVAQPTFMADTTSDQQPVSNGAKAPVFPGFQPKLVSKATMAQPPVFGGHSATFGQPSGPVALDARTFSPAPQKPNLASSAATTSGFASAPPFISAGPANGTVPNPFAATVALPSATVQGGHLPAAPVNPFSGVQQTSAASSASSASNPFTKLLQKSNEVPPNPSQPQSTGIFGKPSPFAAISQPSTASSSFANVQQTSNNPLTNMAQPLPQPAFNQGGGGFGLLQKPSTSLEDGAAQSQAPTTGQVSSSSAAFKVLKQSKLDSSVPNGNDGKLSVFAGTANVAPAGNPFGASPQTSSASLAGSGIFGNTAFSASSVEPQGPSPFGSGTSGVFSPSSGFKNKQGGTFSVTTNNAATSASSEKRRAGPPAVPTGPQTQYAKRIYDQLRNDGITAPKWPKTPGAPASRGEMEKLREATNSYRSKVRASLMKAGIIDDPTVQKDLKDAIDFKGICEDMCPDFEKMTRIVQFDVKAEEKTEASDGTMCASTPHMVKAMARSAAGQDRPLPMDVLTIAALKRTLNYLVDEVLVEDKNLPARHNFLWDRTRAVRRDFIFHSTKSPEELAQMVYCFENITRFHVTALHLLSQKSFAAPDFSEQQELEQLSKALLSLMETYDDCNKRGVQCENEAEFRAYFILLNSHKYQQTMSEWNSDVWYDSDEVQTAVSLAEAIQSVWDRDGPIRPAVPAATGSAFASYFRILEQPSVSYTMACFAEIHFTRIRRAILEDLVKAYSRGKQTPKDITVPVVNQKLRFDTEDEATDFVTRHGLRFASEGGNQKYLILDRTVRIDRPTTRQSFSQHLVERKRSNRPLPEVIHTTVLEQPTVSPVSEDNAEDSLFVKQTPRAGGARHHDMATATATGLKHLPALASLERSHPTSPVSMVTPTPVAALPAFPGGVGSTSAQPVSIFSKIPALPTPPGPSSTAPVTPFAAAPSTPGFLPTASAPVEIAPVASAGQGKIVEKFAQNPFGHSEATSETPAFSSILSRSSNAVSSASSLFLSPAEKLSTPNITLTPPTPQFPIPAPGARDGVTAQSSAAAPTPAPQPAPQTQTQPPPQRSILSASTGRHPQSIFSSAPETSTSKSSVAPPPAGPATPSPPKAPDFFTQPPARSDPMGDFTKWVVLGDGGLLNEFQTAFTQHLLTEVFAQHQMEEEERKRREDDEKSWADARKFRQYSLGVKFFYRWRQNARSNSLNRRIQQGNNALKAWQAQKAEERREARKKAQAEAEAELESRRASMESNYVDELRVSVQQRKDRRMEEALLATGVLTGVRDERGLVADIVRDASSATETQSSLSPSPKMRQEHFRVLRDGVSRSTSRVKNMLSRSASIRGAYETKPISMSPPSEGTRSLRHSFASKMRLPSLSQSLPHGAGRPTNFSRFSQTTSTKADVHGGLPAGQKSNIRSSHWRLRAMGMIQMPNKQYLHESLAIPLLEGKRFPAVGSYGLPPGDKDPGRPSDEPTWPHSVSPQAKRKMTPNYEELGDGDYAAFDVGRQLDGESSSIAKKHKSFDGDGAQTRLRAAMKTTTVSTEAPLPHQRSLLASQSPPNKRKRAHDDDAGGVTKAADVMLSRDRGSPSGAKKQKGYNREEAEKILDEMRELGAQMDADKEWFREQNEMMEKGISPWDR